MYAPDDAVEQVARHCTPLDGSQTQAVISRLLLNATYRARPDVGREPAASMPGDHTFHNNADIWQAVLDHQLGYNSRVFLESFFLLEWLPQSPGLYFTEAGRQAREEARQHIESIQEGVIVYTPYGKASMLDGGVGNIRLLPIGDAFVMMSASSTGICHQGFPVALPIALYDAWIDEIRERGAAVRTLVGRLKYIPKELLTLYQGYSDVPRLYLYIEEDLSPARPMTRPMDGLKVSIAVSFVSTFEGGPKTYACYVNFDPSSRQSFKDNMEWMEHDYVVGRYRGRVLTNFDEHETHFAHADISVKKVMSLTLNEAELQRVSQEVHIDTAYLAGALIGQAKIEEVYMESKYKVTGGQIGAMGDNAQAHDFTMVSQPASQPLDLPLLAQELAQLRLEASKQATEPEDKLAVGAIDAAEAAAKKGDAPGALRYLKSAGEFALKVAESIGTKLAVEVIKKQIGL